MMTTQQLAEAAGNLAGILARGFDLHIRDHGPDGSYAIRTEAGDRYQVEQMPGGAAVSHLSYQGEEFAVYVVKASQFKVVPGDNPDLPVYGTGPRRRLLPGRRR